MCNECGLKPVYEFTNKRKLCKNCFIRYFHKKFLYIIRKFGLIRGGDVVGYKNDGGVKGVVLKEMLNFFAERSGVELVEMPSSKKMDRIAVDSSLDSEANEVIRVMIKKSAKNLNVFPRDKKIIRPLYLFLDKELSLYAKLRNLSFKEKRVKKTKISEFLEKMESKHPELKRAIVNSYLELYD